MYLAVDDASAAADTYVGVEVHGTAMYMSLSFSVQTHAVYTHELFIRGMLALHRRMLKSDRRNLHKAK